VVALVGSDSKVVYEPLPADDPMQRKPDISQAKALLGWQPSIPLDDGLPRTVEYFRAIINRTGSPSI
ncbi:MAG: SDR family NAD-dependent epimerase/dehydratase, partial [Gammaproteobacteria bacterium]|nr:SDR family NAD-dependent epimerase/dehydratase [Gammaproteobacteria bacterium]